MSPVLALASAAPGVYSRTWVTLAGARRLPPNWVGEMIPDRILAMRNTPARNTVRGALIGCAVTLGFCAPAPTARAQTGQQYFESKVRPILVNRRPMSRRKETEGGFATDDAG